jgi:hypothetical protein
MALGRASHESAWRPALLAGAGVLGLAGVVAAFAAYRRSTPKGPPRIALIGDSYAVGLGPQLTKLLPNFQYEGHVGTSTQQWATGAPGCGQCGRWIPAYQPDVTVVVLGVNDGGVAKLANYQAIANALRANGSQVLWVEPPAGVTTPTVGQTRAVIAALGVPTVPATGTPIAADGVHPQQYAGWASEVARSVRQSET